MPVWLAHGIVDFVFSLRKILGRYRNSVVLKNLRNSFPEIDEDEIQKIADNFYRHILDLIFETLKLLTISKGTIEQHVEFTGTEVLEKLNREKRSLILVMGHLGNWELCGLRVCTALKCPLIGIYHPIANRYFDRMFRHMRERNGMQLVTMHDAARLMIKKKHQVTATGFIADQTPSYTDAYWMMFLNQATLVFKGLAKMAKRLNQPVVYVSVKKMIRGHYSVCTELLIDKPEEYSEDEITQIHMRRLEQDILNQPEIWLWSHKRWKKTIPDDMVLEDLLEDKGN